jgi:ribosomal protein L31
MEKKTYWAEATVKIKVEFEVEATTEEEAFALAKDSIIGDYNLDVHGYNHDVYTENGKNTTIDLEVGEYDED